MCTDNGIGDGGAKALADALKTNTALAELNLWGAFACRLWTDFSCVQ